MLSREESESLSGPKVSPKQERAGNSKIVLRVWGLGVADDTLHRWKRAAQRTFDRNYVLVNRDYAH